MASDLEDQHAFAERLRIQLQSRYRGMRVSRDPARFGLLVRGPSVEARLPLTPIQLDCLAQPARAGELIAGWVRSVEPQLTPGAPVAFALTRLLWCVRSRSYLDQLARADELLTVALGAELHAFVAESLPGVVMRGVPRQEWESDGLDDQTVRAAADHNTTARFSQLPERIRSTAHVPKDGWRLGGDVLFQGSVLMIPEVLRAFAERAGGDVLIAVPDRALALALPAGSNSVPAFTRRVNQAYREAMTPCSRRLLVTDGSRLGEAPPDAGARSGPDLMAWLRD